MKYLSISSDIKLPVDAVTQTIAIVARKRVGKTYTASVQAEEYIKAGLPGVVLDPTGAWWGLKASADGKSEGFPVVVIGGSHADIPLEDTAGKIIADLVVDRPGFYVIDFSQIESDAAIHRFALDFAKRFYFRKEGARFPMTLFIDEADVFIPQNPFGEEKRMLHAFDVIVRRGGIRGIGVVLITQRPAVLSKNVLTQCETLITLQISGSQDIDALQHWTRVHGTKEQREEYYSSISSLAIGEAWIWSPSWLQVFKRIRIRTRETFNSSATPKAGEKAVVPQKLAAVDIQKLTAEIKQTVERAKENDPAELKRKVATLERELQQLKAAPVKTAPVDKSLIYAEAEAAVRKELLKPIQWYEKEMEKFWRELGMTLGQISIATSKCGEIKRPVLPHVLNRPLADVGLSSKTIVVNTTLDGLNSVIRKIKSDSPATRPELTVPGMGRIPVSQTATPSGTATRLPEGEKTVLIAIAQHPDGVDREQLSVLTGYKRSTRDRYLQLLGQKGLIGTNNSGIIVALQAGIDALGDSFDPLPKGQGLIAHWLAKLPGGEHKIFELLVLEGPLSREVISERTNYKRSTRDRYLQLLAARKLIVSDGGNIRINQRHFE